MKLDRIGFAPPIVEREAESQGEIPYTISRLEWLEIKLNAWVGCMRKLDSVFFFYRANPKENTIKICILQSSNADPSTIDHTRSLAQQIVAKHVESYGWDWVNIIEEVETWESDL